MKILSALIIFFFSLGLVSCASAVTPHREAYILAQPHGWIELEVLDTNVPSQLPPKKLSEEQKLKWKPKPPTCSMIVTLNNERFLYENIFPFGDTPPYRVDTGFRFPAPIGDLKITISYIGCDIKDSKEISTSFSSTVSVVENMVTPIDFNGETFEFGDFEKNSAITLEDIYLKLEDLEIK